MLRGSHSAKIDEKGRFKMPAAYRHYINEHYGNQFYVTSLDGECARVYPLQEWMSIEEKLQSKGTMDPDVKKFLDVTNYYGQLADMDSQGRILVHSRLRAKAELSGDVDVVGYLQYLEVWTHEKFKARVDKEPYSSADMANISRLGV